MQATDFEPFEGHDFARLDEIVTFKRSAISCCICSLRRIADIDQVVVDHVYRAFAAPITA